MKYKTIRNKTYNNVIYIGKLLQTLKGYPEKESYLQAVKMFDNNDFNGRSIECIFNNLITWDEVLAHRALHEFNMRGIY